jgi:hypothetical protein
LVETEEAETQEDLEETSVTVVVEEDFNFLIKVLF